MWAVVFKKCSEIWLVVLFSASFREKYQSDCSDHQLLQNGSFADEIVELKNTF